jgi:hypothetical protein
VFVETGPVVPLAVRIRLVAAARSAELGTQPGAPAADVAVPGSTGAAALEWRWPYSLAPGRAPVPSRQVELLVQTSDREQYGLLLGGPADVVTDELVRTLETTLAVVPVTGSA